MRVFVIIFFFLDEDYCQSFLPFTKKKISIHFTIVYSYWNAIVCFSNPIHESDIIVFTNRICGCTAEVAWNFYDIFLYLGKRDTNQQCLIWMFGRTTWLLCSWAGGICVICTSKDLCNVSKFPGNDMHGNQSKWYWRYSTICRFFNIKHEELIFM